MEDRQGRHPKAHAGAIAIVIIWAAITAVPWNWFGLRQPPLAKTT
jgi:hypothetical protein